MLINDDARARMLALAKSEAMREGLPPTQENSDNPFMVDGEVDCDLVVEFLTQYNKLVGHRRKPRTPFIETNMKL